MADQNFANNELQGANPLAYLGVPATTPPNYYRIPRAPTSADIQGFRVGDFWLDTSVATPTASNVWNLLGKDAGIGDWVNFTGASGSGILQIEGDTGGPENPDGGGIFNFTGGTTGLSFAGSTNTQTLDGILVVPHGGTGAASFTAYAPVIGGTTSTGTLDSADIGISNVGWVLTSTGAASAPTWQATGSGNISITGDSGGAQVASAFTFTGATTGLTFAGAANIFTLGGILVVANGGTGVNTLTDHGVMLGSGTSPVSVTAVGTNGQVLIGATGADPAFATITSSGGTIVFTPGANSLNMEATVTGNLTITQLDDTDSPYVVLSGDQYLSCDITAGTLQINLPNSTTNGRIIRIKDAVGLSSFNNITVTTVGGSVNIDGATSYIMNSDFQALNVVYNATTTAYEIF